MSSCRNCPSFVGSAERDKQAEVYGTVTNVPSCVTRGIMLGLPSARFEAQEDAFVEAAKTCPSYGKPVGDRKIGLRIGVGQPPAPTGTNPVKSCRACHFWLPAQYIASKMEVGMGLCTKFGNLIPDNKTSPVAASCKVGVRTATGSLDPEQHREALWASMHLSPLIARFMEPDADAPLLYSGADTDTDPTVYATDRPVTAQQTAKGIRAWRRLASGDNEVYLPIFDVNFFSKEERAKIPRTGDDEHPEKYVDHMGLVYIVACLWMELDETPALHGVAGTGKTELFRHMAWLMCLPFDRISITRSSEREDLEGKMHFENNETTYKYGRLPKAWRKPGVVLLDEPNVGPPEVWQLIRPLTDNSKQMVVDANEGEVITRDAFAFLGMAMNPAWDHRNVGAEVIGDADGSRLMHIFVDLPPREMEEGIIRERCKLDGYDLPEAKLRLIMNVAEELRTNADEGTLPVTWGIRNQIKVARATRWFDIRKSYQLAVADYLEPAVKQTILDIVESHGKAGR